MFVFGSADIFVMDEPFLCKRTPAFSRAADSDEEDEEEKLQNSSLNKTVLRLTPEVRCELAAPENAGYLANCCTLVVAVGPIATCFVDAYLLGGSLENCDILGLLGAGLPCGTRNTLSQTAMDDTTCWLLRPRIYPQLLICRNRVPILPEQTHSFVELLLNLLQPDQLEVVIFGCARDGSKETFCTKADVDNVLRLRALRTSRQYGRLAAPFLEPPAMAVGLPAQFLSGCQLRSLSATLYLLCGLSSSGCMFSSDDVCAFEPVLLTAVFREIMTHLNMNIKSGNDALHSILSRSKPHIVSPSNMYT